MLRLLAVLLLISASAWGQGGTGGGQGSGTYGLGGYSGYLTPFSSNPSAIVSNETGNAPSPKALYLNAPLVQGYNSNTGAYTYENMFTSYLTNTGTVTNHYGQAEQSLILQGSGTLNAELNQEKKLTTISAGLTLNFGENLETSLWNYGTITGIWSGVTMNPTNWGTGFISIMNGMQWAPVNTNTNSNTVQQYIGWLCKQPTGGGTPALFENACFWNQDPTAEIVNQGHYANRNDNGAPAFNGTCGTAPALNARGGDASGQLTMGTGSTTCTMTFYQPYVGAMSTVVVLPSDGGSLPTYTYSTTAITFSAIRAGGVYQYWVIGGY